MPRLDAFKLRYLSLFYTAASDQQPNWAHVDRYLWINENVSHLYIKAKGYISTLPIFSHISGLEVGMSTMLDGCTVGWISK